MTVARTCPKCQSFDVRAVTVQGDDLRAYSCHDCLHLFYITVDDLHTEQDDMRAGKVRRLPKKK
jgi:hypothetical protein